jgi:predicted GTPase
VRMSAVPVIALIDGEHHPSVVREALARLDLAGVVFCGGEEKLAPGPLEEHYGMAVETEVEEGLRRLAPTRCPAPGSSRRVTSGSASTGRSSP